MLPLDGAHQVQNLGAALAAAALLEPRWIRNGDAVAEALAGTRLGGRLQAHPRDPRLRLDVGHNELAAVAIAGWLRGTDRPPARVVLGMYADKDVEAVAAALGDAVDYWHCAGLPGPRGQDGKILAERLRSVPGRRGTVLAHDEVATALDAALAEAAENQPVVVFGSFVTVAQALEHLDASADS
jgi:dihydrofolate synthase/folylpolyglutamate synthase